MKSYKGLLIPFWFGVFTLLLSCSNDDEGIEDTSVSNFPSYSVIGENFQGVFQFNYDGLDESGQLINLTEENNVLREYLTLRQVSETLTFFIFSAGKFSAVQRNYITGETNFVNEFYTDSNERSVIWGATSESQIFMANYSPRGSTNFGVRIIDLVTQEEEDLIVDFDVNNVYQPLYLNGRLFLGYMDSNSNHKLAVVDTNLNTLIRTFDFGQFAPSIFIAKDKNIGIISGNNSSDYSFTLYDISSLEPIQEESLIINRFFSPGAIQTQAEFANNGLYYLNFYFQPSPISFGPAYYDFVQKENTIIDMVSIAQEVQDEIGIPLEISAFDYEEESDTFLVGYTTFESPDLLKGGILIISREGELLLREALDFAPDYFIRQ
ncbi:hypothetical protein [Eudoraea chungangensis]|uniref:hypothetical protein n=1 Tax=Eudoraea chungangensis TaxID=1481905 RepID=UPI0023EB8347|nr:hypothetical protein [Eudoraea chungangensis]